MEKMNMGTFKKVLGEMVASTLNKSGEDVTIEIVDVNKNNQKKTGFAIKAAGSNLAPTIYVEELYEKYLAGAALEDLRDEAISIYKKAKKLPLPDVNDDILSRKYLAENAFISLMGYESNMDYVKDIVGAIVFKDIFAAVRVNIPTEEKGYMQSFALTYDALESTGLTGIEIIAAAKANTIEKGFECIEMSELIRQLFQSTPEDMPSVEKEMFVLTNHGKCLGASAMLDYTLLKNLWEEIGDFYILPSSIHEVIAISEDADDASDVRELTKLVQDVNSESVAPEDKLTDSVYRFDGIAVRKVS